MTTETSNAFIGKAEPPTETEIAMALGASASAWNEFVEWMAKEEGITGREWKGVVVKKYGWSLRLQQKKRNIVYMSPCKGCFRVGFVLSDKAMQAVRATKFSKAVSDTISTAPKYPEGTGIRLVVRKASDLSPIRKLAHIKVTN